MGSKGPFKTIFKMKPEVNRSVFERAKALKVPHKNPPNNTYELHWKFGRYVCQLKRLTFNYCTYSGSSRGLRYFIDFEAEKFVKDNPQTSVYFQQRNGKDPRLVANYMNGQDRIISVPNHDSIAIWDWLERLKNESGRQWRSERLHQPWLTSTPSIQGTWNPFLHKPPVNINPEYYIHRNKNS
ncbi:uncharacterized protein LOC100202924 [Hydra vulgaris]|uniref:Large ribosomal subunit protein mL43 n=1 Tax=Hydra vulgaris TaxID=6087 RepID=A0ABM4BHE0_HYDVU